MQRTSKKQTTGIHGQSQHDKETQSIRRIPYITTGNSPRLRMGRTFCVAQSIKKVSRFQTHPKINWVKSHQDDKVYGAKEMPLDAYLNSEADELATIGLKRLQEKPQVPMDPNTNIQLHIGGRTITRDLKKTAREIIQLPMLRTILL
jgi:hypothetical protein